MLRYILKRLVQGIFVLLGVSIVIFALSRIIPGDPARLALGQHATQEAVDTLSKQMFIEESQAMAWSYFGLVLIVIVAVYLLVDRHVFYNN